MARPPDRPRPRHRRRRDARANDERILDAAVVLLATEGWSQLTYARIGQHAGLSAAPIRERFPDRADLAACAWERRLGHVFTDALSAVVAATPRPADGPVDIPAATEAMRAALRPLQHPDQQLRAALECVVMARFEPVVAEAVTASWRSVQTEWCHATIVGPAQAARQAFAMAEALGLLLLSAGVPLPALEVDEPVAAMVQAMSVDAQPQPLPPERAAHLDLGAVFDTDDPALDALLQAALDEVGTRGYDGATVEIIARSAGYSRGIIQNRYAGKREVFLDATRRMLHAAVMLNEQYAQALSQRYSAGLAEAALMREFMDPSRDLVRAISIEQMRVAWHDSEVAAAMAQEVGAVRESLLQDAGQTDEGAHARWHFGLAAGQGTALLAYLCPEAAGLPFDVVTAPMQGSIPKAPP